MQQELSFKLVLFLAYRNASSVYNLAIFLSFICNIPVFKGLAFPVNHLGNL